MRRGLTLVVFKPKTNWHEYTASKMIIMCGVTYDGLQVYQLKSVAMIYIEVCLQSSNWDSCCHLLCSPIRRKVS
jgi:hypothetical protein